MCEKQSDLQVDVYRVTEKARHCEFCRFAALEGGLQCRKHAPAFDIERRQTCWPPVQSWHWCGDFEVDQERWRDAVRRHPWLREEK